MGPVASFKHALIVARIPKTRSGKVLRATLKSVADGTPFKVCVRVCVVVMMVLEW